MLVIAQGAAGLVQPHGPIVHPRQQPSGVRMAEAEALIDDQPLTGVARVKRVRL